MPCSSSCSTCTTGSCTCCVVTNVAVDQQLVVGQETILQTSSVTGGALQVTSCCSQTSGELVTITGTPTTTALLVENGDFIVQDSNDDDVLHVDASTKEIHLLGHAVFEQESIPLDSADTANTANGKQSEIRVDGDYIYVCVDPSSATEKWKRVLLSVWP